MSAPLFAMIAETLLNPYDSLVKSSRPLTLSHRRLMVKVNFQADIKGILHKWIDNYLTGRQHKHV